MKLSLDDAAQEVSNYLGRSAEATSIPGFMIVVGDRYLHIFVADDGKLAMLDFGDAVPVVAQASKSKQTYQ